MKSLSCEQALLMMGGGRGETLYVRLYVCSSYGLILNFKHYFCYYILDLDLIMCDRNQFSILLEDVVDETLLLEDEDEEETLLLEDEHDHKESGPDRPIRIGK